MLNIEILDKMIHCVASNYIKIISHCFYIIKGLSQEIKNNSLLITTTNKEIFFVDKIFREIRLSQSKYKM
jgi:hypothetical protein